MNIRQQGLVGPSNSLPDSTSHVPEISILLLGDAGVGKSTFLSRLTLGSKGVALKARDLPKLKDLDQPFSFDITLYNRPYKFKFYDTSSPTNYTLLQPSVVILCYSIADPESLSSIHGHWRKLVETHFNHDEQLPIILLGLMRDARQKEDYEGPVKPLDSGGTGESDVLHGRKVVYPQEGLSVAQRMRIDRYCECSALTGELCREVFEDIARTAALTTTDQGGKSQETFCGIM